MKTEYFHDRYGHQAVTLIPMLHDVQQRGLTISTSKWPDGNLTTTATVRTLRDGTYVLAISTNGQGDFYKKLSAEYMPRATAELVKLQHDKCMESLEQLKLEVEHHYRVQHSWEHNCVAGH